MQERSFGCGHPELEGWCVLGLIDPADDRLGMRHVRCQYTRRGRRALRYRFLPRFPAHARDRASHGARRPGARCRPPRSLTGDPPHPSRDGMRRRGSLFWIPSPPINALNFRRKMLEFEILQPLDARRRVGVQRPARCCSTSRASSKAPSTRSFRTLGSAACSRCSSSRSFCVIRGQR